MYINTISVEVSVLGRLSTHVAVSRESRVVHASPGVDITSMFIMKCG